MSTQTQASLNTAQQSIYSRSNIRRAFQDFDDTDVAAINLRDDSCIVVYRDGCERVFPKQLIKDAFVAYTHRLKDFFSYLGPNYRGPSIWHNNSYVLFKGWCYQHALGHLSSNAHLQAAWADKFIHLNEAEKLKALLQSDQTDLGYLVAPDGFRYVHSPELGSSFDDEENDTADVHKTPEPTPYCSCGSFQRQLNNLADFQQEIAGYKPWCIHLTWFKKYRDLLSERARVRSESRGQAPEKCVAWWYAPPSDHTGDGRFVLLHTKSGAQAPLTHWKLYKPSEVFTKDNAWDLFFNMMAADYVPFPGTALPQLSSFAKK
jgi:hypothetical protein